MDKRYPKSRKIHTKSRTGCVECKRRHIRCDETRPICDRCIFSSRECVYTASAQGRGSDSRDVPTTVSGRGWHGADTVSIPASSLSQPNAAGLSLKPLANSPRSSADVNLDHLELLYHFEAETCKTIAITEEQVAVYQRAVISHGFQNRHLMYQILALSALHLSLQRPLRQGFYKDLASDLQSKALTGFHELLENVDEANCVDVVIFSHLIAMQVFCDTFDSLQDDFNVFLERLVGCIRLLNGVDAVINKWRSELSQTQMGLFMAEAEKRYKKAKPSLSECRDLQVMISKADLSPSSIRTCQEALTRLQRYLDLENTLEKPSASSNTIFAWLVTSTPEFTDLLDQRKPEALVILAYYAVLLHKRRDSWVIGNAGGRLFRRMNLYLGSHWQNWLAWPLSILGESSGAPTPTGPFMRAETSHASTPGWKIVSKSSSRSEGALSQEQAKTQSAELPQFGTVGNLPADR